MTLEEQLLQQAAATVEGLEKWLTKPPIEFSPEHRYDFDYRYETDLERVKVIHAELKDALTRKDAAAIRKDWTNTCYWVRQRMLHGLTSLFPLLVKTKDGVFLTGYELATDEPTADQQPEDAPPAVETGDQTKAASPTEPVPNPSPSEPPTDRENTNT
jgi:hypothetical protein